MALTWLLLRAIYNKLILIFSSNKQLLFIHEKISKSIEVKFRNLRPDSNVAVALSSTLGRRFNPSHAKSCVKID